MAVVAILAGLANARMVEISWSPLYKKLGATCNFQAFPSMRHCCRVEQAALVQFRYQGVGGGVGDKEVGGANSGEGSGGAEDREVVIVALAGVGGVIEATIGTNMGEGGWLIDEHPSTMTQQKLDQLREKYVIPSSVRLRRLIGNEKLSTPLLGWVTLCADMLKQEDHGKCPGIIAAGAQCRADHKPDVALFPVEEESVPGQLLLPLECVE
ncbi:unnamed protein product [Prunus armeniaca]